jgi:NAD(P)H-dependent FMN reductase
MLGTTRRGARSAAVAKLVAARAGLQPDVDASLIEVGALGLVTGDEGTAIKDPDFSALIQRSDGLVIVTPEYNHGYPASLKHALDTNYHEYVHKPVGLVGVSTGPLGGARVIENLLPVLRAVGLVPLQRDVNVANVAERFPEAAAPNDERLLRRIDGMLTELRWMATVLRYGRETVSVRPDQPAVTCPTCASLMNPHGDIIDAARQGAPLRVHTCPRCGENQVTNPG